jgi:hypothetical protein
VVALGDDSASGKSAAKAGTRLQRGQKCQHKEKAIQMTFDPKSVEEKLTELQKIWKKSRTHGRGRFAFYRYLRAVYDWYAELRTIGCANKTRDEIIKLHKLSKKLRQTHAINVIIAATSKEDQRTVSRWAQALRYAWRCRHLRQQHRITLKEFFQKKGGPAGCATKLKSRIKPNLD